MVTVKGCDPQLIHHTAKVREWWQSTSLPRLTMQCLPSAICHQQDEDGNHTISISGRWPATRLTINFSGQITSSPSGDAPCFVVLGWDNTLIGLSISASQVLKIWNWSTNSGFLGTVYSLLFQIALTNFSAILIIIRRHWYSAKVLYTVKKEYEITFGGRYVVSIDYG